MAISATTNANTSATSSRLAPMAVESTTRAGLRCVRSRSRAERLLAAASLLTEHAFPEGALVLMHEMQMLLMQQEPSHGSQSLREDR